MSIKIWYWHNACLDARGYRCALRSALGGVFYASAPKGLKLVKRGYWGGLKESARSKVRNFKWAQRYGTGVMLAWKHVDLVFSINYLGNLPSWCTQGPLQDLASGFPPLLELCLLTTAVCTPMWALSMPLQVCTKQIYFPGNACFNVVQFVFVLLFDYFALQFHGCL